ncbi:MAG TPA: type II secretion system protein [Usitatibacter sp.]|nr:type II secretion system protein [Usitatibacter sp.]
MVTQRRFNYAAALAALAVLGVAGGAVATSWSLEGQREREHELLVVGAEYRTAIERYVAAAPSGRRQYPRSLHDLVRDPRFPGIVRHIRRLHADPLTGRAEWGQVPAPDGGIMGVYSLASGQPLKTGGFASRDARFTGAASYRDWIFAYRERYSGNASDFAAAP